jgi:predicted phage terminase large subunit-like protein
VVSATNVRLTADLIYGFTGGLLSSRFDEPAPTPDCHREWWELCCSEHKRVAIAAPRGHAKSTGITKAYTLAAVLFRARSFVLVISDTYKQAVLFLGEIKRELDGNEDLRKLFGVKDFLTDREDDVIVQMEDGHCFRLMALGSEQKVRGLLWDGKRPDMVVGDDLENDEIVMNPDRREKFRAWFFNALLPALSGKGIVRIVGTILHMDSALERLMPKDRDKNTIHLPLKSYMDKPQNGWMSVRYRAHNEDFSQVLWPVKWTKERLTEIRAMFISQGNPEGYYQEYLNRPIDPTNTFFKREDFNEFEERDFDRTWTHSPTYLSLDGAFSTKEKRDWCAFGVGSIDESGVLYIRHVIRERQDPKEVIDTIIRLQDRFKFNTLLIGKGAYEKSIGPFLRDELRKKGRFLHMETIAEPIDKRLRAQSIRGRMRAGGVKFNKRGRWYSDLEQELMEFDRGTHDDQVDMMSLFGMFLDSLMSAPDKQEVEDLEWEDEHPTKDQDMNQGRSLITGY